MIESQKNILIIKELFINLHRVSLIRPAPVKLPQIRKEARVQWLSGAI